VSKTKSSSPQKPLTLWRAKDRCLQQGQNPAHHRSHSLPGEPRTGVMSRVQMHLTTEATHFLESRGQASSGGTKCSHHRSHSLPGWVSSARTNSAHHGNHSHSGEQRTGVMSRDKIQLTTEATHSLESQGQVS